MLSVMVMTASPTPLHLIRVVSGVSPSSTIVDKVDSLLALPPAAEGSITSTAFGLVDDADIMLPYREWERIT